MKPLKQKPPIKSLIRQFLEYAERSEDFRRQADYYSKAIKTEEWKFLHTAIHLIMNKMLQHMLSKEFTSLDETEKDVTQRTYYNINQILTFLLDPSLWVRNRSKWLKSLSQLKGKVIPNQQKGK